MSPAIQMFLALFGSYVVYRLWAKEFDRWDTRRRRWRRPTR